MSDDATTKDLPELSKDAQGILDAVKKLSVLELANLVQHMEEEFGVSAAAPVAMMAGGGGAAGGGDDGGAAEKSEFNVVLASPGGSKIGVIKIVKDLLGVGLKEAKDLVDGAPKPIKENVPKEEAEKMKAQLEEAGATVELQ